MKCQSSLMIQFPSFYLNFLWFIAKLSIVRHTDSSVDILVEKNQCFILSFFSLKLDLRAIAKIYRCEKVAWNMGLWFPISTIAACVSCCLMVYNFLWPDHPSSSHTHTKHKSKLKGGTVLLNFCQKPTKGITTIQQCIIVATKRSRGGLGVSVVGCF